MFYFILENINHQLEGILLFFSTCGTQQTEVKKAFCFALPRLGQSMKQAKYWRGIHLHTRTERDNSLFLVAVFYVITIYFFNHSGCIQVVSGSGRTQWIIILLAYTGSFMSCSASWFVRGRWNPIKVKLKATKSITALFFLFMKHWTVEYSNDSLY